MKQIILTVDIYGTCNEIQLKMEDLGELHKKCGFKKADNFELRHSWRNRENKICIYGRTTGKALTENKYELPPPLDNTLFFGKLAILQLDSNDQIIDISRETWNAFYTKLFKGCEYLKDTCSEDDNEPDELEMISPEMKTKNGYLKDGFVVEEDGDEDNCTNDDSEDDMENSIEDTDTEETAMLQSDENEESDTDDELIHEAYISSDSDS